ncbi:MAG TPA: ATP-binding protein [Bacteroidia bacterium]|nr:ATP-binding protein [Bacteroidia bacterium]
MNTLSGAGSKAGQEDWNPELDRVLQKNFIIGTWIAVCMNSLFATTIFFQDQVHDLYEFGIRMTSSALMCLTFLIRNKIKIPIRYYIAIPVFILIVQDAYFLSTLDESEITGYTLAHTANFIGAALLLIWPLSFSLVFWSVIALFHIGFYMTFSEVPVYTFLENGGWLLIGVFILTVTFIQVRFSGLVNMIKVRKELERNNEWMHIQNNIIENKSLQLQKSNERLKEFAYIVSHDLKAPLRGIRNIAGWLHEDSGPFLNKEGKSHLLLLEKQVVKMEQLISSVLEYAKAENQKRGSEWIELDDLTNELVESIGTDGKTVFTLKIGVSRMLGAKVVVWQVLQNLVSNSIKHNNKENGKVEIEVRDTGTQLHFTVSDNGPGISEVEREKIFELFATTGSSDGYTNTGIGLPVAKKLIEESGGKIWLESIPEQGTSFHFTLPREF